MSRIDLFVGLLRISDVGFSFKGSIVSVGATLGLVGLGGLTSLPAPPPPRRVSPPDVTVSLGLGGDASKESKLGFKMDTVEALPVDIPSSSSRSGELDTAF